MIFGNKILDYWDDILEDLKAMIAIPSVSGEPEGEYVFGKDSARAIDLAMELSAKYDLPAKNVDYYAMHTEYGQGEGNAVVLAHIDVVPAGSGWETDPFEMVIKDGKIIGRGILDDKGSAIVALHCLRALRDAGIQGNRKLRVVMGSSEETGMQDMEYYFSREQHPDLGFTPDGDYGICHCEKGILTYSAQGKNDSDVIKSFHSGTVSNAVPDSAVCSVICSEEEFLTLKTEAEKTPGMFQISKTPLGADISAKGKISHAANPETGINAASHLVSLLYKVFKQRIGSFFLYIYEKVGVSYDGSQIDIAMADEVSGPLTFNLGIVNTDDKNCSLTVNIRYPATKDGAAISETLKRETEAYGLGYTLLSDASPLYLPKEGPLVTLLSKAYTAVTGKPCSIYSMGGGTYARQMFGKGVAFGPFFPENPDGIAHTANEFVYIENLKLHAQICLEAMYYMFTAAEEDI